MSGDTRQVAPLSPASVAVHNDGDVLGESRRIQVAVDVAFLAIQPLGYFVLQSDLSEREYHRGQQGAMTGRVFSCWSSGSVGRALLPATQATARCGVQLDGLMTLELGLVQLVDGSKTLAGKSARPTLGLSGLPPARLSTP